MRIVFEQSRLRAERRDMQKWLEDWRASSALVVRRLVAGAVSLLANS